MPISILPQVRLQLMRDCRVTPTNQARTISGDGSILVTVTRKSNDGVTPPIHAYTSTHLLYVFGQFCSMFICIFAVREAGLHEFIECDAEHGFDAMTLTIQNSSVNMELPA